MTVFDAAVSGNGPWSEFGYLFRGTHYYKYRWRQPLGVIQGYPLPIAKEWNRPSDLTDDFLKSVCPWINGINAAVNGGGSFEGQALLFRDSRYQVYSWLDDIAVGEPQEIFALGIPEPFASGLDAAVEGQGQFAGKALLFRGNLLASFEWHTGRFTLLEFDTLGLPTLFADGIGAALTGRLSRAPYAYFFKDDQYVRYDWSTMNVSLVSPPYPDKIDRMNSRKPWPGLKLSQPAVTDSNRLRVKITYGEASGTPGISLTNTICDIWTGTPMTGYTAALDSGTATSAAIDTEETEFLGLFPNTIYLFKHLDEHTVNVRIEPFSIFSGNGQVSVTLTILDAIMQDTIMFEPHCVGFTETLEPITFTAKFSKKEVN